MGLARKLLKSSCHYRCCLNNNEETGEERKKQLQANFYVTSWDRRRKTVMFDKFYR